MNVVPGTPAPLLANALPRIAEFLDQSIQTVVAVCSPQGTILTGNALLWRLMSHVPGSGRGAGITQLLRAAEGSADAFPATLQPGESCRWTTRLWHGDAMCFCHWFRAADHLVLFGELTLAGQEEVLNQLTTLVNEAAAASRELSRHNRLLQEANARIEALTRQDALTRLGNRRHLEERLEEMLSFCRRQGLPLSLAMADLDHFKQVNDTFGHGVGDAVLVAFAEVLRTASRKEDLLCRFGGEEFIMVLPGTDATSAYRYAERLRKRLRSLRVRPDGQPISASFGIARLEPGDNPSILIKRADEALYTAKREGRNRTVVIPRTAGPAGASGTT